MDSNMIKNEISRWISQADKTVFLRGDFKNFGEYAQVGRALGKLVKSEEIVRIGYGIYVRTRPSLIRKGARTLATPGGFKGAAYDALDRLGVKWRPSEAETAYNEGRSTQIPANASVIIRGRFSRRISFDGMSLRYEKHEKHT